MVLPHPPFDASVVCVEGDYYPLSHQHPQAVVARRGGRFRFSAKVRAPAEKKIPSSHLLSPLQGRLKNAKRRILSLPFFESGVLATGDGRVHVAKTRFTQSCSTEKSKKGSNVTQPSSKKRDYVHSPGLEQP